MHRRTGRWWVEEEMMVRRRAARAVRVLGHLFLATGWLATFGALILFLAGKFDEGKLTTAILNSAADIIIAILLKEFAGIIERREWP